MKKTLIIFLLIVTVALLLAACGGGEKEPPTPATTTPLPAGAVGDATKGAELFTKNCQACHGKGGVGVQGLGKDMRTSEFIANISDAELLDFIKTGRPVSDPANTTGVDMPAKGGSLTLTDEQLLDIIAYIRSFQK